MDSDLTLQLCRVNYSAALSKSCIMFSVRTKIALPVRCEQPHALAAAKSNFHWMALDPFISASTKKTITALKRANVPAYIAACYPFHTPEIRQYCVWTIRLRNICSKCTFCYNKKQNMLIWAPPKIDGRIDSRNNRNNVHCFKNYNVLNYIGNSWCMQSTFPIHFILLLFLLEIYLWIVYFCFSISYTPHALEYTHIHREYYASGSWNWINQRYDDDVPGYVPCSESLCMEN